MERKAFHSLNFWMGKPPHIPVALHRWGSERASENPFRQAWDLGDRPRAGVRAVGVPIRSWKGMAGDSPRQRLPGIQHPREPASWSSPSEAWRRFPGAVPFQLVSILKPGDNERPVSGASIFSFLFFSPQFTLFLETVEPVVVEAESSGIFSSVWQPLLFPEEAQWCFSWAQQCGRCGLDSLLPRELTHWSLWKRCGRTGMGRQQRKKQGRLSVGGSLFIAPEMVFVQLSWTFVEVQIWELCS